jgi:hypothetical protein
MMTSSEKANLVKDLRMHLKEFRSARMYVSIAAVRHREVVPLYKDDIGFHALRIAEIMDRLNGSTR